MFMHLNKKHFMIRLVKLIATLITAVSLISISSAQAQSGNQDASDTIAWQPWSDAIFEQAKREKKLVILDLEAVWCHWCHVMDEETYHNPAILKLIQKHFIAVRVDQDASPDISIRYEDYGWPATVIFAADGSELIKRRGYIAPENMQRILNAIIKDPTPGPSIQKPSEIIIGSSTQLSQAQLNAISNDINNGYDNTLGGWGNEHKFILAQNVEYALISAKQGDKALEQKALETLDKALALIDPTWGGVYQYSDRGRWNSPHFEKIMSIQADGLRLYSLAYKQYGKASYLKAARDIERYLNDFLTSPEGAFYTSQDADVNAQLDGHAFYPLDDKARRALGTMPRIDKNIYARENGWAIRGLVALYDATGDKHTLSRAIQAANWTSANRDLGAGGFKHGAKDGARPYLGDTLAMAEAYLALYTSTGDRAWLEKSKSAMQFINKNFKLNTEKHNAGFTAVVAQQTNTGVFKTPLLQMEENASVARLANQLSHYTGEKQYKEMANHAIKYLVALATPDYPQYLAVALLASRELASDPAHITIVGAKNNPESARLFQAALQLPIVYRRIEWWDKNEGPMPNSDVKYPQLEKPAAFICANSACSAPIFEPEKISIKANSILGANDE